MPRFPAIITAALALTLPLAPAALAGPIDPPAGPIAPTHKTLTDVEPRIPISQATTPAGDAYRYVISEPGSYYLTGNVNGIAGRGGIRIAASNVTLDLNGFTVSGVSQAITGISAAPGVHTITITNGIVANWPGAGIDLEGKSNCHVRAITARNNSGSGIVVGDNAAIEACTASANGGTGVDTGNGGVIRAVTASGNGAIGIKGSSYSTIESCSASNNGSDGILVGNGSIARGCTSSSNTGTGIRAHDSSQVIDCIAIANSSSGVAAGWGVHVARCTASANTSHGIQFGAQCHIVGNFCRGNGVGATVGAGLYNVANTAGSRIEGNTCAQNDLGIYINGTSNIILGNTCTANGTNFYIVANNRAGAIILPPTTGQISGNAGGPGLGTTDPSANLAF